MNAESFANGIRNGVVVGSGDGDSTGSNSIALRWNADNTATNLHSQIALSGIDLGMNAYSSGIDGENGVTVGYGGGSNTGTSNFGYNDNALRWNADGTVTNLHILAAPLLGANASSDASAISNGVIVGYGSNKNGISALRWNADGTVTDLNSLAAAAIGDHPQSSASGIAGGVIVGYGYGNKTGEVSNAFRWNADGTALNLQPFVTGGAAAYGSTANAIDPVTGIIVGETSASNGRYGALWTPLNAGGGGANSLTIQQGVTTTINQSFLQSAGNTTVNGILDMTGKTFTLAGGILKGSGTVIGNVNNNGGTIAPGNSPGNLSVNGNFVQTAGTLAMEIAGVNAGQFDRLSVTGTATLGGSLNVLSYGGFDLSSLSVGQTFDILSATGGITGTFDSVTNGWQFSTVNNNTGRLTYTGTPVAAPEAGTGLLALLAGMPVLAFVAARRK